MRRRIKWTDLNIKDQIAYVLAVLLIASGMVMAFMCFFMTEDHDVNQGVLFYVSESFITGGGLLSVSLYVKNKMFEMSNYMHHRLDHPDEPPIEELDDMTNLSTEEQ